MFYDRFIQICNEHNVTPSQVAIRCGFNKSSVTNWKKNGYAPRQEILLKIAEYFNVSVDYLLGNETDFKSQTESVISDDDIKFALWGDVADEIPNDKLQEVKTFAEFIKNTYKKDNNK